MKNDLSSADRTFSFLLKPILNAFCMEDMHFVAGQRINNVIIFEIFGANAARFALFVQLRTLRVHFLSSLHHKEDVARFANARGEASSQGWNGASSLQLNSFVLVGLGWLGDLGVFIADLIFLLFSSCRLFFVTAEETILASQVTAKEHNDRNPNPRDNIDYGHPLIPITNVFNLALVSYGISD